MIRLSFLSRKTRKESTPIDTDTDAEVEVESPTTPTKALERPGWRGRGRGVRPLGGEGTSRAGLRAGRTGKAPTKVDEDDDEAEEVASLIASERSESVGYSSDD